MARENLLEKVIKKIEEIEPDKWVRSEKKSTNVENFGLKLPGIDKEYFHLDITYSTNVENFNVALESRYCKWSISLCTFSLKLYKDGEQFATFDGCDATYKDIRTNAAVGSLIEDLFCSVDRDYKNFAERKIQQPSKTEILLSELLGKLGGK